MHNYEIADQFSMLAKLMDIHGENTFKIKSYTNAAYILDKLATPVSEMPANELFAIKGIGEAIGSKILQLIENKRLTILEAYIEKTPPGILEMLKIKGLGPKKIITIWKELEIETVGELLYACEENRLINYKGFGAKTQQNIQEALEYYLQHQGSFLFQQVESLAHHLQSILEEAFPNEKHIISGLFKRQMETIDYLDIVTTVSKKILIDWLQQKDFTIIDSNSFISCKGVDNFELRWWMASAENFYWTDFSLSCSAEFLQKWVENPLFEKNYTFSSELSIFDQLGIAYIPSPQREDPQLLSTLFLDNNKKSVARCIQETDIKGIIHSHSTWSDGIHTLEQMATAAKQAGYEYLVISDHSKSAFYANGLEIERIRAQHKEIDALNKKLTPFVIFKSIESDILNDGSLDYPQEILASFDIVIASIHSNLKMSEEKAMSRLLNAINNPYTSILGHLTGRLLLSRKGYPVNHTAIIDACSENNVTIELNAHPRRLDIDWRYINEAIKKDVLISINPDAHAIEGFSDCKYGVKVAQKAGLTAAQNLSSFSLQEMMEFVSFQHAKRN